MDFNRLDFACWFDFKLESILYVMKPAEEIFNGNNGTQNKKTHNFTKLGVNSLLENVIYMNK